MHEQREFMTKAEQPAGGRAGAVVAEERRERTGLVLQLVQPFTSFCYLRDVVAHNSNSIVDLGLNRCGFGVSSTGRVGRRAAAARKIRIVGLRPVTTQSKGMATSWRDKRDEKV